MAVEKLHPLLKNAVGKLKELIPQFDRGGKFHNESVFGALSELRMLSLPETLIDLPVEYSPAIDDENILGIARCEVEKIEAAANVLAQSERIDLADSLSYAANEIKNALDSIGGWPGQSERSERAPD